MFGFTKKHYLKKCIINSEAQACIYNYLIHNVYKTKNYRNKISIDSYLDLYGL